ncbi:MAG: hypothetical protein Q9218_002446 [Villophora microphyllina]
MILVDGGPCLDKLLQRIPNIRELYLANSDIEFAIPTPGVLEMNQLETLKLVSCTANVSAQCLPSLRIFRLQDHYPTDLSSPVDTSNLRNSSLVEFSVSMSNELLLHDILSALGPKTDGLRKFNVSHSLGIGNAGLRTLITGGILDQVVDLDISGLDGTRDDIMELLLLKAHRLKRVSLSSTKITGITIKALITKPGDRLEYLDISHCQRISADAIALARDQRGLIVKCNSETMKGARRVRYG